MTQAILVTGGAGYVGAHTCKALARAGFLPVAYDNLSNGARRLVKWGPLVEGDVLDGEGLLRSLREHRIEGVIHMAARIEVGESLRDPLAFFRTNVGGAVTLIEAARKAGLAHCVFSSTAAVYGQPRMVPIPETHETLPVNPYGESKLAVERALFWAEQAHGLRHIALRYFNACGADPEGEAGECHDPETHLVPLVIGAGLGRRPPVEVYGTDYPTEDGTAVRDYVHVSDLAAAHVMALQHLLRGGESFVANLGTGKGLSVRQILDATAEVLGRTVPSRPGPRRAGDPPLLVADPSAARGRLGWEPVHSSLPQIIETALAWHRDNG